MTTPLVVPPARTRPSKAVIPAAGLGTRLLPATKVQSKAMLAIIDKPAIQYVVEEAARAGLHDILVVTDPGESTIAAHFAPAPDLEAELERRGKHALLEAVRATSRIAALHFVADEPLGLGHAVAVAQGHVGDEPFAVLLADELMDESSTLLADMVAAHEAHGHTVVALKEVSDEEISLYGAARLDSDGTRVLDVVEKPPPGAAPSNLALTGRYVLTPEIFDALARVGPGVGGELQLTDAIGLLAREGTVRPHIYTGGRHDVGNRLEIVKATVEMALAREDLAEPFALFLKGIVQLQRTGGAGVPAGQAMSDERRAGGTVQRRPR